MDSFVELENPLRQKYGRDLSESLTALINAAKQNQLDLPFFDLDVVKATKFNVQARLHEQFDCIHQALFAGDCRVSWLAISNMMPIVTPTTILEQLRTISNQKFGLSMEENLVSYGVLVTTLQRCYRIEQALLKEDMVKYNDELRNIGKS